MSKRISKTVTLALVLATCIAFLFITPAQACEPPKPPNVKIWKKFLSTSDPPPYKMGIEYHWDVEIGVSTEVDLNDAKVSDNFGAELKIDEIITPDKTYTFTYLDYESKYPTNQAKVTISDGTTITHKLDWIGVTFGNKPYKFHIDWSGQTHKVHFEWYIGELKAGKTITVTIGISTDLNPGGKQEFTSTCEHCINSGAVLKAIWKDRCRCRYISAESEQLYVKVQCEVPRPAKLILDKFNDTNGNGIYDDGDIKIPNWKIDVKDPDEITTTYLTPTTIEITEFGTYTITEELPSNWEQTALRVDGAYLAPTVTTTIPINEGEPHDILYGNKLRPPLPGKLIIEKFNDTNGNGVFDTGIDIMITGWKVNVTDPHAVTTSYFTPISLDITDFGTYTITEDLPGGWRQTAVYIDGVKKPTSRTVTVDINPGDAHNVLYGNQKIPPPPPVGISLAIKPTKVVLPGTSTMSWVIDPGGTTPVKVTFTLYKPDMTIAYQWIDNTPPIDLTGTYTHSFTLADPTGFWNVMVLYEYEYLGFPGSVLAGGTIYVVSP